MLGSLPGPVPRANHDCHGKTPVHAEHGLVEWNLRFLRVSTATAA